MSQNTHTLHLLFEDRLRLRLAQLVFQYLGDGGTQEASRWAAEWNGADPAALWNADWFNAEVHAPAGHLIVRFDAGKHDALPLQALEHMFERGLSAAVLETFYDQVGETQRLYFLLGEWVPRSALMAAHPAWVAAAEHAPADPPDGDAHRVCAAEARDPRQPMAVADLRAQEERQQREAQAAAKEMVELIQVLGKGGGGASAMSAGVTGLWLVRAGFKGLMHAVAFTVFALVCFKGKWMWLGLGVVLAVALPLLYMVLEYRSLRGAGTG